MNCSEFERELEQLAESRGGSLPDSAATHAAQCAACRQRWSDHRLLERVLTAWRPVRCPESLAGTVLAQLQAADVPRPPRRAVTLRMTWPVAAAAAACLIAALGFGIAMRPGADSHSLTHHTLPARTPVPSNAVSAEPSIEVASSVTAVLDDLHAEYRELAAETSATARELSSVLPAPLIVTWVDAGVAGTGGTDRVPDEAVRTGDSRPPAGAVSLIGRSIGSQIGQAMDFLRIAVPESVPPG